MKTEDLGGILLFTSDTHRFGTDAVLLADFANKKRFSSCCDIGTGCGIIAMLLARDNPGAQITAVDIQPEAIALVEKAIEVNALAGRMNAVCSDVRELSRRMKGKYELAVCNPPYKRAGAGLVTGNDGIDIARTERHGTFAEITAAAADILISGGRFCVCSRPDRLTDVLSAMRGSKIEPKRLQMVSAKPGKAPMLFLCEGIKGAKNGLAVEPELYMQNSDGTDTAEISQIYKSWREYLKERK